MKKIFKKMPPILAVALIFNILILNVASASAQGSITSESNELGDYKEIQAEIIEQDGEKVILTEDGEIINPWDLEPIIIEDEPMLMTASGEVIEPQAIGAVVIFIGSLLAGYIIDGAIINLTGKSGAQWGAAALLYFKKNPKCGKIYFSKSTGNPRCHSGARGKFSLEY